MNRYEILNYGKPIEIIGTPQRRGRGRTCVAFYTHKNETTGNVYVRINVSGDIAKDFQGKRLEIVALGEAFAIVPDNNGRFTLSKGTISGANSATNLWLMESVKASLDEHNKVDAVKVNNAYIFPHIPIVKE